MFILVPSPRPKDSYTNAKPRMDPSIDALVAGLRASRQRFRKTTEQELRQLQVELAGFGTAKIVPTPFVGTPTRLTVANGMNASPHTVEPLRERLRELKAHMSAEEAGGAQLMAALRDRQAGSNKTGGPSCIPAY